MTKHNAFTVLLGLFLALLIYSFIHVSMKYTKENAELVKQNVSNKQACNERFMGIGK